jgi:hypothetical protein
VERQAVRDQLERCDPLAAKVLLNELDRITEAVKKGKEKHDHSTTE